MKTSLPPSRSSLTTKDAPANGSQKFEARRSKNASAAEVQADGATWKERLAVCEGVTPEGQPNLKIRSYYRNQFTGERVWDEPPSGASQVVFSTAEMRKHAEQQMKELQFTLDLIPDDVHNNSNSDDADSKKKGKKSLFGRFKKKDKTAATLKDDSKDLNLQKAIARSMADQRGGSFGGGSDEPVVYYDPEGNIDALAEATENGSISMRAQMSQLQQQEQDDIALAQALSMSAREASSGSASAAPQHHAMSDDEMLQQALEASRIESARDGAISAVPSAQELDRHTPVSSSAQSLNSFDPYSPGNAASSSSSSLTPEITMKKTAAAPAGDSSPPQKMELEEGRKKPVARTVNRRVFGGRKKVENKAGVV